MYHSLHETLPIASTEDCLLLATARSEKHRAYRYYNITVVWSAIRFVDRVRELHLCLSSWLHWRELQNLIIILVLLLDVTTVDSSFTTLFATSEAKS